MRYFVYELKRQADDADPFYIGLTRDPETRSRQHKQKHGLSVQFTILYDFAAEDEAMAKEKELIKWHSERGNILNLLGVKGSRRARKGMHALLTAKRAEKRRLREERAALLIQEMQAKEEARKIRHQEAYKAKQEATAKRKTATSVTAVSDAFIVLRGLLTGTPTPKEVALAALETIRLAPGAMELAHVYIKANII